MTESIALVAVLAAFIILLAYRLTLSLIRKRKARFIWQKHFSKDKVYSADEVARVFNLETAQLHRLLKILEQYHYFRFFNRRGVTMVKDYYSSYELKRLVFLVMKKERLSL